MSSVLDFVVASLILSTLSSTFAWIFGVKVMMISFGRYFERIGLPKNYVKFYIRFSLQKGAFFDQLEALMKSGSLFILNTNFQESEDMLLLKF